jgi:hypothetical protein
VSERFYSNEYIKGNDGQGGVSDELVDDLILEVFPATKSVTYCSTHIIEQLNKHYTGPSRQCQCWGDPIYEQTRCGHFGALIICDIETSYFLFFEQRVGLRW